MTKIDELYSRYYNTTDPMKLIQKKRKISYDELLHKMILEKDMIADIICNTTSANKVVEFADACYIDDNVLIPTVGESLYNKGKKVKIISPNIRTTYNNSFSTIEVNKNNTFGRYSIVTPDKIRSVDLFISEQYTIDHMKHFIDLAGFGKICAFTSNGSVKDLIEKYEEIKRMFYELSKSDNLEYDLNITADNDIAAAVYTIKRK